MRVLSFGSTGPAVQLLQLALDRAINADIAADGIFGNATRDALISFQSASGLVPDGIAGPLTHRALHPWYTGYTVHTVARGDTVYKLARLYGSSEQAVLTANPGLNVLQLRIGSRLVIPLGFDVVPTGISWFSELTGFCVSGLTARYPFIAAGEIGRSVMGAPLHRLTLGTGRNRVLYNAAHHANEWITIPLLLKFTEQLAAAYASGGLIFDQSAAEILSYAAVCIVPCVNPDGTDLVTGELQSGEYYAAARRIAADYPQFSFPEGWKANIRGTDPNLQYPAGWERARDNKAALGIVSPAPQDYVGPAPLTAPESRAMYEYTLLFDSALTLSYHTQGQVIYPRFLDMEPENSLEIARIFSAVSGYAVEDTPDIAGYAGYKDWFIQNYDRPGYTVEAGLGRNPLPISDFDGIYAANLGILTLGTLVT